MGHICHHAIIVTASAGDIQKARRAAQRLKLAVSGIVVSPLNDYQSFFVAPDGSKEGWEESYEGDRKRGLLIDWLREQEEEDGSSPYDWLEVFYDPDARTAGVEEHSCDEPYKEC